MAPSLISAATPATGDKFAFLKDLTSDSKHGRSTFYAHLLSVHRSLTKLQLPPAVCDAGLFHSIYGTEFYPSSRPPSREAVRSYIGSYAEELVFVFCGIKEGRFRVIVDNGLGLEKGMWLDLCLVEFANIWDQRNRPGREEGARRKLGVLEERIAGLKVEIWGQVSSLGDGGEDLS